MSDNTQSTEELLNTLEEENNIEELKSQAEVVAEKEWTTEKLSELDSLEMEKLIRDLYVQKGYLSDKTQRTRDGGVDVIAEAEEKTVFIEVKHWASSSFGVNDLRPPLASARYPEVRHNGVPKSEREVDELHAFATCGFSFDAKVNAKEINENDYDMSVKLIDSKELVYLLNKYNIPIKEYL